MNDLEALPAVRSACARVITKGGVVGTGYLVDRNTVATCHHVVKSVKAPDEVVECRFGEDGEVTLTAKVVASDERTDSALLRLDADMPARVTPLEVLRGPTWLRTDVWSIGFPQFTVKKAGDLATAVNIHGRISSTSQRSPEKVENTVVLEVENFKGKLPYSVGGFSGSPVLVGRQVIGHISSVLGSTEDPKAPHLGLAYAVRGAGVLRLLGRKPARPDLPLSWRIAASIAFGGVASAAFLVAALAFYEAYDPEPWGTRPSNALLFGESLVVGFLVATIAGGVAVYRSRRFPMEAE
jgi:hypothetical protein